MTAGSKATARPNDVIWQQRSARGPIRAIRRILLGFAVVSLLGIAQAALATSFSTDQSDLWYVPTESGWGMQLVQRDSIIFATLFVYDMNNKPTWYVATLTYQGNLVWNGDLLATTGPWFGAIPFDASTVVVRKVGTMSWTAQTRHSRNDLVLRRRRERLEEHHKAVARCWKTTADITPAPPTAPCLCARIRRRTRSPRPSA